MGNSRLVQHQRELHYVQQVVDAAVGGRVSLSYSYDYFAHGAESAYQLDMDAVKRYVIVRGLIVYSLCFENYYSILLFSYSILIITDKYCNS